MLGIYLASCSYDKTRANMNTTVIKLLLFKLLVLTTWVGSKACTIDPDCTLFYSPKAVLFRIKFAHLSSEKQRNL